MKIRQWAAQNGLTIRVDYKRSTIITPSGAEAVVEDHEAWIVSTIQLVGSDAFEIVSRHGDTPEQALSELASAIRGGSSRCPDGHYLAVPVDLQ